MNSRRDRSGLMLDAMGLVSSEHFWRGVRRVCVTAKDAGSDVEAGVDLQCS